MSRVLFIASIIVPVCRVCSHAAPVAAQGASPTGSLPAYSTYGFSSEGEWLAYIVRPASMDAQSSLEAPNSWVADDYFGNIWVFNLRTGEQRNISEGLGPSWFPKWSPHGNLLAFLANRSAAGDASLWIWNSSSGERRQVSNAKILAGGGIPLEWAPDGRSIFATIIPADASLGPRSKQAQRPSHRENDKGMWSETLHDPGQLRDLLRIDIDKGKATTLVHDRIIATHAASPDGSRIAYTVVSGQAKGFLVFDLAVVNLATLRQKVLALNIPLNNTDGHFAWSPDSKFLAYRRSEFISRTGDIENGAGEITTRDDCFVVDVDHHPLPRNISHLSAPQLYTAGFSKQCWWDKNGTHLYFVFNGAFWQATVSDGASGPISKIPGHHLIWPSFPETPEALEFVDERERILATAKRNDSTKREDLYEIDLKTGQSMRVVASLTNGQRQRHMYDPYSVSPDGSRVAYVMEDVHGPDLWVTDMTFKTPRRVTQLKPEAMQEREQN